MSRLLRWISQSDTGFSSTWRFLVNVSSNLGLMVLNSGITIWFTPFLVTHLGVASYGLIPLATSLTAYINVIGSALNASVSRYLTVDIQRDQPDVANRTFNTAFWGSIFVSLALIPVLLIFVKYVPRIFSIPPGQVYGAQILFMVVLLSYLLGIISSMFRTSAFVRNRFDLYNFPQVVELIVRVAVVVILFSFLASQVWQVGVGILIGAIISMLLTIWVWRLLTPELSINLRLFDFPRLRALLDTSGWMLTNQVGSLLFLNIDLIVINIFLGSVASGLYGSILQWPTLLRVTANTVASVLTPMVIAYYARGDFERMTFVLQQSIKILGLTIALPVGLVWGLSHSLLYVWLGPEFVVVSGIMSVLTAHLAINLAVLPLFSVMVAMNKVRIPGLVSLGLGIVNLLLALWWVHLEPNGLGVAVAGALTLTVKNTIFTPAYGAYIQKKPLKTYFFRIFPGILGSLLVGGISYFVSYLLLINTWSKLLLIMAIISFFYMFVTYFFFLDKDDRMLILRFRSGIKTSSLVSAQEHLGDSNER